MALERDIVGVTISALYGQVEYRDVRLTLESTPFALGSIAALQTELTATFTAGSLRVISPFGPTVTFPLAGRGLGTIPVFGSMGFTASNVFELDVSLFAFELDFSASGFNGTILSTGSFTATSLCLFASPYCATAPNSLGLESRVALVGRPSVSRNEIELKAIFLPQQTPGASSARSRPAYHRRVQTST